jgi:hypothetical protein
MPERSRCKQRLYSAAAASTEVHYQADKEQNQKYEEQNLCDPGCCNRDSAETEESRNEGDQQEN